VARKDLPAAEREARMAMQDEYARLPASVVLAQVMVQRNQLSEALALVNQTAEEAARKSLGPIDNLDYVRGDILARMNRFDDAIAALGREIDPFPHKRQPYANLALVHALQGKPAEAQAAI
jgi:predicted negative regulator of RcsB-dependent stress response